MASFFHRLESLPPELKTYIRSHLSNFDVKNIRLASRQGSLIFRLHDNRVYLSANSHNIKVLRTIADHPKYRFDIQELIWDDARLLKQPGETPVGWDSGDENDYEEESTGSNGPSWFRVACKRSIEELQYSPGHDGPLPQHLRKRKRLQARWDFGKCWEYYEMLLEDEDEVLKSGSDTEALNYALERFPALQRIIITPTAHGILFLPVYKTPMIRRFPDHFVYPIPRTWPSICKENSVTPEVMSWTEDQPDEFFAHYRYGPGTPYRELWRGYSIVLQALADSSNAVTELIVDTTGFETGVNCFAVCNDCAEERNLRTFCSKSGCRRLDLTVALNGQEADAFAPLRSGSLYSTLATAKDMQHFHFATDLDMDGSGTMAQLDIYDERIDKHLVPLLTLFPVTAWSNLRVFCLTKFLVLNSDLVGFLGKLPPSLKRLELNFLLFLQEGTYRELLNEMRKQLCWSDRPAKARVNVSISLPPHWCRGNDLVVATLNKSVMEFLYADGINPFYDEEDSDGGGGNYAKWNLGDVEWDWFDPEHYRAFEDQETQRKRGYYGYMSWEETDE